MDFAYSPRTQELQARLSAFMAEHVYPAETTWFEEIEANTRAGRRWTPLQVIEQLKPKAHAAGLWNLFLPPRAEGHGPDTSTLGAGLSNQEYAPLAEIMGAVPCPARSSIAAPPTPATWKCWRATARRNTSSAGCSRCCAARCAAPSR